ncbi:squalene/phytoene synthase family protein [Staphylococcus gallinarum]|uniref:squalene/phytoene synthase family protein n=1 Tax=Staphylococcus gallinarum TaxID=1293 RepID=UPI001E2E26C0|nr:squalene/phytoene synthase family protein [Staphylococcus gallinarum]MCD8844646.1 squalene/phytoene synthase family protein [Staphylococcus gallinarum]
MGNLEKEYKYCQKIMKNYTKTFANAFEHLSTEKRNALWSIYALYHNVDESIKVHKDIEYLNKIKHDVQQIYNGETKKFHSNTKIMKPSAQTIHLYNLPRSALETFIQTVEDDFVFSANDTDQQLEQYCYGVSGVIGELLNPIFTQSQIEATKVAEANAMSIALGKALQLTKILRNVGKDYSNGKIYISIEKLEYYNVDLDSIYYNGVTPNYAHLWESYANLIERSFSYILDHLYLFDDDIEPIIVLTIKTYQGLLEEVRKNLYDVTKHANLSSYKKSKIYRNVMETYSKS